MAKTIKKIVLIKRFLVLAVQLIVGIMYVIRHVLPIYALRFVHNIKEAWKFGMSKIIMRCDFQNEEIFIYFFLRYPFVRL